MRLRLDNISLFKFVLVTNNVNVFNKLEKANIVKSRSQYNVNTRERSRSPLRNTVNTDVDRIDKNEAILDVKTHYKPTETFQYTHYSSCHPPGVKKGFIKGEAIRGVCVGLSMTFSITLTLLVTRTNLKRLILSSLDHNTM